MYQIPVLTLQNSILHSLSANEDFQATFVGRNIKLIIQLF
jgi:hypothetical protein